MSDYLAVGGVSAVLKSLLSTALTQGGPSTILGAAAGITNVAPDLIPTGPDETAQLNLFLYYASINPALRNNDLPSMSARGGRLSNPPLAINLHYLISAYGAAPYDSEILLAWAMQVFHNTPVVPRAVIQQALADLVAVLPATPQQTLISASTLASQIEHIRITPETLTTEEIYRLWTAFQTNYRPTTSYQVSVVVIQDTQGYTSNPPVQRRSLVALPLLGPIVETVTPSATAEGQTLTLTGSNFLGDNPVDTTVSFDSNPSIPAETVQDNVVRAAIPVALQAGTQSVRVLRSVTFPSSPQPHPSFASNPVPFQLLPTILPPAAPPPPPAPAYSATQGGSLTLKLSPAVGVLQKVVVYIGDQALPMPSLPLSGPQTVPQITIAVPASIAVGNYPLRVEVDGAQSRLALDTSVSPPVWQPQIGVTA